MASWLLEPYWDAVRMREIESLLGKTLHTLTGASFNVVAIAPRDPDRIVTIKLASSGREICISEAQLKLVLDHANSGGSISPRDLRNIGAAHTSYLGAIVAELTGAPFPNSSQGPKRTTLPQPLIVVRDIRTSERNGMRHAILETESMRWHVTLRTMVDPSGWETGVSYWIRREGSMAIDDEHALRAAIQDVEAWLKGRQPTDRGPAVPSGRNRAVTASDAEQWLLDEGIDIALYAREMSASLGPRLTDVLVCRYERSMTLDEIGRLYGLSRERIRQLEKKALQKLKRSWTRSRVTSPTSAE